MENKINDILEELDKNVDLSETYILNQISASNYSDTTINDLKNDLKDANISGDKHVKIYKTNTINFDSLTKEELKDINLHEETNDKKPFFSYFFELFKNLKNKIPPTPLNKGDNMGETHDPITETIWYLENNYIFTKKFFIKTWIIFLLLFTIIVIDKNIVESKINSGYEKLLSIKDNSWNIDFIKKQVEWAQSDFKWGSILFTPFLIIPHHDIDNWYNVLKWWKELTNIMVISLEVYDSTKKYLVDNWWVENIKLTSLLFDLKGDFSKIMILLYNTIVYYDNINDLPNEDLNKKFELARTKLKETYKYLDILNKDYDVFLNLLWHTNERKYLLIFQNNDEIRATWWFIWSVATVTLKSWKVTSFVKEDVYSYEWDINKVMVDKQPAPEWLNKITKTFWFRDSNYFVSFEDSSNSIKSFIDKIDRHVDWIVYINQNTILDLLKYTWWVKFDQLNETITEENFSLIISTLVESKVFKVWSLWTPKQILFDFANVFTWILKEKKDYYAYLDIILKSIKSRDIVIYSFNPEENNLLWKLWLNWKVNYKETMDFAYPVYTSVWWNKSDRYIQLKYKKNIVKNADCSIDTNLDIYRTHLFSKTEEQKVNDLLDHHWVTDKKDIINIQWKWDNKSYVRVLLPLNAIIEPKEWMNITKTENYQMVDYYHDTRLLETVNFDIKYKLPNPKCEKYSYKLYKQPWIRKYNLQINDKTNVLKEEGVEGDYVY